MDGHAQPGPGNQPDCYRCGAKGHRAGDPACKGKDGEVHKDAPEWYRKQNKGGKGRGKGKGKGKGIQNGACCWHQMAIDYWMLMHGNPKPPRHRFAVYCDDISAGANTLEEVYELFEALICCCAKAGIQIKARKSEVCLGSEASLFTITSFQNMVQNQRRPICARSGT